VLPFDARRNRRNGRDRRPPVSAAVERLEMRELLAYSPLGVSLPDLTVSGFTAPVAAWGAPFAVTVDVQNLGSSSIIEPTQLAPGSASTADAPPSKVDVIFHTGFGPRARSVVVGVIDVPAIQQNSLVRITQDFPQLPARPPGFAAFNQNVFVSFQLEPFPTSISNGNPTDNKLSFAPQPVRLLPPLPELAVVGLDVPPVMQPGDTIQPNIEIANFGTVNSAPQGPVPVFLVASATPSLRGASVIASFSIEALPGLSEVPQTRTVLGDVNVDQPINIDTLIGSAVTLPTSPAVYYLSVLVDPNNSIRQLHQLGRSIRVQATTPPTQPLHKVGPPIPGLPPAGVVTAPSSALTNPFPFPSFPVNNLQTPTTGSLTVAAANQFAPAGTPAQPAGSAASLLRIASRSARVNQSTRIGRSTGLGTNPILGP
jgi:hypothetical protein